MEKRYQVFVSSTYADLKNERQHVLQALMEMDCIPAGMELFPATDEEQWAFIQRIIDDCDYYLLIIGGRYGSTTSDGISYTEKEFDYATQKGIKVVALIHGEPDNIPFGKSEQNPELREKLLSFKSKVMNGRLVKFWKTAEDLPGLVALSLTKTIKAYPAIGWIRANQIASADILSEINELRKTNSKLQETVSNLQKETSSKPEYEDIADINSLYTVHGHYNTYINGANVRRSFECTISWRDIFKLIAPYMLEPQNDGAFKMNLSNSLKAHATGNSSGSSIWIEDQEFKTIAIQLQAYGLIKNQYAQTTKGGMALFWSLTNKGQKFMMETRVIRSEQ